MAKKITVVTYDSDAPACRNIFINQADSKAIGTSEVDLLAKQIGRTGEIAVVSAAASATNQNAWIAYMKTQLKKYPDMKLVDVVYGNDDPTVSTQVTQGLLQKHPNLKGIISPTTVGIAAAAAVLDTAKYRGKIKLTGLGTPNSLRKYVKDGTIEGFELWNPADLGYLAAYAAVNHASGDDQRQEGPDVQGRHARRRTGSARRARCCSGRRSCSTRRTSTSSTSRRRARGACRTDSSGTPPRLLRDDRRPATPLAPARLEVVRRDPRARGRLDRPVRRRGRTPSSARTAPASRRS